MREMYSNFMYVGNTARSRKIENGKWNFLFFIYWKLLKKSEERNEKKRIENGTIC